MQIINILHTDYTSCSLHTTKIYQLKMISFFDESDKVKTVQLSKCPISSFLARLHSDRDNVTQTSQLIARKLKPCSEVEFSRGALLPQWSLLEPDKEKVFLHVGLFVLYCQKPVVSDQSHCVAYCINLVVRLMILPEILKYLGDVGVNNLYG